MIRAGTVGPDGMDSRGAEATDCGVTTVDTQSVETRFGVFTGRARDVLTLVEGLPGFENCRRFFLLSSPTIEPLMCLQGVDGARPSFLVVDPRLADPGFRCTLDDLQSRRLGASSGAALLWLAIVRLSDDEDASVNLRAPLVVNPDKMRGMQLLSGHDDYPVDHRLR